MRHERPLNSGGVRSSALWGRGGRETRSSALWGRGGRSAVALLVLLLGFIIPTAGLAGGGKGGGGSTTTTSTTTTSTTTTSTTTTSTTTSTSGSSNYRALVPPDLLSAAQADESQKFDVVIQGPRSVSSDRLASDIKSDLSSGSVDPMKRIKRRFKVITGLSIQITGTELLKLARNPQVTTITRDAKLSIVGGGDWSVTDPEDSGMWRESVGAPALWDQAGSVAPQAPTVAIVDTGIDATKTADFDSRVVARANFSSLEPNATGDPSGHGTMVAGVVAGNQSTYPGVARNARLVDVRVASSAGEALTSDVVAAVDWIIANKTTYNIRVANFSLVGTSQTSFRFDPLDKAVEKLWLNGVVVVASAGNNGFPNGPAPIGAPANDPFVITVGALDITRTVNPADDVRASWSAYGPTADGFMKPDVSAPGRYIVMPVPMGSVIQSRMSNRTVAPGYMWMSGTSFSAPVVAGAAAQILARNPSFTPDQVKGALMLTAVYLPSQDPGAGVGEINAAASAFVSSPPNPNANLYQFVSNGFFDAEAWAAYVTTNSNWTTSNWTSANWTSANWTASNWVSANWTAANWVSANWTASNWTAANWTASNWTASASVE
jgi:serine protease AprX